MVLYFWLPVIILHSPEANAGCLWNSVTLPPGRHLLQHPLCLTSPHRVTPPKRQQHLKYPNSVLKPLHRHAAQEADAWPRALPVSLLPGNMAISPSDERRFVALLTLFHAEGDPFDLFGLARLITDENSTFVHLAVLKAGGCIKWKRGCPTILRAGRLQILFLFGFSGWENASFVSLTHLRGTKYGIPLLGC